MISLFQSLTIGGKLIIIGFWLLGIIVLWAWAVFIARRLDARRLPTKILSQGIEECKKSAPRSYKGAKHQKPQSQFWIRRLLSSCHHIIKDNGVRCPADNCGDQCKQPAHRVKSKDFGRIRVIPPISISHIRTIVNRLRRRVNQSGKEPFFSPGFSLLRRWKEPRPVQYDDRYLSKSRRLLSRIAEMTSSLLS